MDTTGPEFEPLAEDFARETLLKVLAHHDSFEGHSQFTTWVHKIAVPVAFTALRRRRWKDVSLESWLDTEHGGATPSFMTDPAPGPEATAERSEILARLQKIMREELTDKQRQALTAMARARFGWAGP